MSQIRREAPLLWPFSANNTHLYPGASLRSLDPPGDIRFSAGNKLLVEFNDGVLISGLLLEAESDTAVLRMPGYRTQRRTTVAERTWHIGPGGEPGLVRVQKHLP